MANSYSSSSSSSVTASQVGSYFVQQYYQVLQQQPEFVHQFYADSSTMVRADGESTETASAIFQIHSLVQSLHFSGIEIKTINSLESWSQGIIVVVSGSVKSKLFTGWKKFVQTFFLAPQEKGYFVMNDIFHFESEEVTHQRPPPEPKVDSQQITSELPVSEDAAYEVEARENLTSLNLEQNNEDGYYNPSQETHLQEEEEEEEDYESESYDEQPPLEDDVQNNTVVDYVQQEQPLHYQNTVDEYVQENTVEYVQEPVSAVVAEPVKFTYASILRSKGKSSPSVSLQPTTAKSVTPAPEWHSTPEPVTQPPPVSSASDSTTQLAQESFTSEEGDSKSVYVRNLPTTVTSQEIFEEFKNFGKIKQDGVFMKNRKDVGVCFAFVEFEDFEGVQRAIEASPIQLAGRQIYIEERRANNSSGSTRGGRGRGGRRGRGDASRGRYGGGSYARGNGFR
ncbi:putative Ras GTPase-activating protein-binding protein [Helianthus anomalus]